MSTQNARRIIGRIRALRAKTVDHGATEAEAASAADMAQRLMAQYQIDDGDIAASFYDRHLHKMRGINLRDRSKSHPFTVVGDGVEHITGTKLWFSHGGVYICGNEVGREMAIYLLDMARNVMDAAWKREARDRVERIDRYLAKMGAPQSTAGLRNVAAFRDDMREIGLGTDALTRRSFLLGMGSRLCMRMCAMPPARSIPADVALRLISDKEIRPDRKGRLPKVDPRSIAAGSRAGESAPISMGVGASATPLAIGKDAA